MTFEIRGSLQGTGLHIGIVAARFNFSITARLLDGAVSSLLTHGVQQDDVSVAWVPGSFEIPVIAKKMAQCGRYDAIICLGAIIRGETDHYKYIASEAARGIATAGFEVGVPVIFGVLTTDTTEQAMERSGGQKTDHLLVGRVDAKPSTQNDAGGESYGNSGYNMGEAAIEMANLVRNLEST